jgi:hypothetical protein
MKTSATLVATLALVSFGMAQSQPPPTAPPGALPAPAEPHHPQPPGQPHYPPPPALEPSRVAPYLGVATAPVPPPLASQLKLDPGFGLLVTNVVPDSPASAAAIESNDVLVKLGDQHLIEPQQFAVLVRNHKPGDEIAIELIRGGEKKIVRVIVGQRSASADHPKRFMLRSKDAHRMMIERSEALKGRKKELESRKEDLQNLKDKLKGLFSDVAISSTVMDDNQTRFELSTNDGISVFRVIKQDGSELFEGPVTNPEDREKVPADYRGKLEQMESIETNGGPLFDALMPAPPRNGPVMHFNEELLETPSV